MTGVMCHVTVQGGRAGEAYGFTIKSLSKLKDTKANKPRMSLLHYIAQVSGLDTQSMLLWLDCRLEDWVR